MMRIDLERLSIRLQGVSRPVAEAAMDGLGEALGRHLARRSVSTLPTVDVFRIDLRETGVSDPRDVAALREAIALRVVDGLTGGRGRMDGEGRG